MKKRGFGFRDAFRGIGNGVLWERNFRVHIAAVLTVVYFGAVFGVTKTQWAVLVLIMGAVMAAELVNTAVEAMVDRLSPEKCEYARIAKDSAAAAVLVLATASVVIAGFIFSEPRGWERVWTYIKGNYVYIAVFAAACVWFVFFAGKKENRK